MAQNTEEKAGKEVSLGCLVLRPMSERPKKGERCLIKMKQTYADHWGKGDPWVIEIARSEDGPCTWNFCWDHDVEGWIPTVSTQNALAQGAPIKDGDSK